MSQECGGIVIFVNTLLVLITIKNLDVVKEVSAVTITLTSGI